MVTVLLVLVGLLVAKVHSRLPEAEAGTCRQWKTLIPTHRRKNGR